jgi:hypothetical protein
MVTALRSIRPLFLLVALPLALPAQDRTDPPGRVGRISSLFGGVSFQTAGTGDLSVAQLNYTVTTGDRLVTSPRARAEMEVGPFAVRIADSTILNVLQLDDDFAHLGISRGTMRVSVYRMERSDSMEISTPNGAVIIRSAGKYRIDVPENGRSTVVTVDDGVVELSGPDLYRMVRGGQSMELTGVNPIQSQFIQRPRYTAFDDWSGERDRREAASDCSRYVSRDMPGCADLSDHGRWSSHPEYGHVWYPARVAPDWVPYRYGRWVWSGPWGWTWVEDAPWGFAPFHYGRWVTVGAVWVWAPGPYVRRPYYAPAYVAFIDGPHFGIGVHAWFPLGWREPYYPRYYHSPRYFRQVNIVHVTNINNYYYGNPRQADYTPYQHRRRATTVVSTETFSRGRPVHQGVVNVRREEIDRAPIARERWATPRGTADTQGRREAATDGRREATPVASRPRTIFADGGSDGIGQRDPVGGTGREAQPRDRSPLVTVGDQPRQPAREAQPRDRSPLVTRYEQPQQPTRSADPLPRQSEERMSRSRPMIDPEPIGSRPVERPLIRRAEQSYPTQPAQPTSRYDVRDRQIQPDQSGPVATRPTESVSRGRTATPSRPPEAQQSAPPRASSPPAQSSPPQSAPSRPRTAGRRPPA